MRKLPDHRVTGRLWSAFHVMNQGQQRRLLEHEVVIQQHGFSLLDRWIFNVNQTACHISATSRMPALLRRSKLWHTKLRRFNDHREASESMGLGPIWGPSDYSSDENHEHKFPTDFDQDTDYLYRLPLFDAIRNKNSDQSDKCFGEKPVGSFNGNGMFVPLMVQIQAFVLACTVPGVSADAS